MASRNPFLGKRPKRVVYQTNSGRMYQGNSEEIIAHELKRFEGKIQLIFTSPPFLLNRKKCYGNLKGTDYVEWLSNFAQPFANLLTTNGSIVIELGNAWESGSPTMSTLALEALMMFKSQANLHLCQEFIWNNPAKLPSPAQWVNVERIRVKDSFTRLWWLSPNPKPKANNRNVLQPYSDSMKELLEKGEYNSGRRPSEHKIGETSFATNNGGAISGSVITCANTSSADNYTKFCRQHGIKLHPARMPKALSKFFIKFLTDEGDLVLDPFAGSNTTGSACQDLKRYWIGIEQNSEFIAGSKGRFSQITNFPSARHEN